MARNWVFYYATEGEIYPLNFQVEADSEADAIKRGLELVDARLLPYITRYWVES